MKRSLTVTLQNQLLELVHSGEISLSGALRTAGISHLQFDEWMKKKRFPERLKRAQIALNRRGRLELDRAAMLSEELMANRIGQKEGLDAPVRELCSTTVKLHHHVRGVKKRAKTPERTEPLQSVVAHPDLHHAESLLSRMEARA